MTRSQKICCGCLGLVFLLAGVLLLAGRFLTREFREREARLQPLLSTNAPLTVITQRAGHFNVFRRGTPEWHRMHSNYLARGWEWDRRIARKMEHAAAIGHTSTMDMQTWIFLDEHDRLVDFELGSQ